MGGEATNLGMTTRILSIGHRMQKKKPKYEHVAKHDWLVVWNIAYFPFHIRDVIPTPLTFTHIFQDGYCTSNQIAHTINHY